MLNPQPYCRCCGKAIKKKVVTHYFGNSRERRTSYSVEHTESATSREEAQRHVNGRIVSSKRGYQGQIIVGVWDGESYTDKHFCSMRCGDAFGRMAADLYPTLDTQEAYDARKARQ